VKKISRFKKILISFAALLILFVASVWVFYNYFFQDYVNDFLKPKLAAAISAATEGHYRLDIERIVYKEGLLYCKGFTLHRVRYDADETGITLESLTQDTVFFKGWHLFDLIWGNGSYMKRMEMHAPKIVVINISDGREKLKNEKPDTLPIPTKLPVRLPVIAFDSIIMTDMRIEVPEKFKPQGPLPYYEGISARLAGFRLDSITMVTEPLLYSKYINFEMPHLSFYTDDSVYTIEAGPIHANLSDSLIRIDSFSFKPDYTDDEFSSLQPYLRGKLDFRCTDISIHGFSLEELMEGKSVMLHSCNIASWNFDYYSDKRKPRELHPEPAVLPNEFIQEFPMPVKIDSLVLADGKIKIRERAEGSKKIRRLAFRPRQDSSLAVLHRYSMG